MCNTGDRLDTQLAKQVHSEIGASAATNSDPRFCHRCPSSKRTPSTKTAGDSSGSQLPGFTPKEQPDGTAIGAQNLSN